MAQYRMNFKIFYMSRHKKCTIDTGKCWCSIGGFTSYRMAAIYAYHHCRCNICRMTTKDDLKELRSELNDLSPGETLEGLWDMCTCSAEWMISEDK